MNDLEKLIELYKSVAQELQVEVKKLEKQRNDLLEILIEYCKSTDFGTYDLLKEIEKIAGKSWEEIKELIK